MTDTRDAPDLPARDHARAALGHTGALVAITARAVAREARHEAAWAGEGRRNAAHAAGILTAAALALWAMTRPVAVEADASWQAVAQAAARCQQQGMTIAADDAGRLACVPVDGDVSAAQAPPVEPEAPAPEAPPPSDALPPVVGVAPPQWMPGTITRFWPSILSAGAKHGVDPMLIGIVVLVESGGNPQAMSGSGARGLAQIMPLTAAGIGADCAAQPYDPAVSIDCGTRYLAQQLRAFGLDDDPDWQRTVERVAAAYNGGPGTAQKWVRGGSLPAETTRYVDWVGGMWRDRNAADSPTLARWLAAGGRVLVQAAERWER